ncbi:hypothetical protein [Melittangium boletus]|uniref:Uncharacterized protein n=1 Tax=Melittangium boletus DSM 14713 TaxID=1294270 RepID=A0A250IFV2_9BACT|nr:hypothetical protein [Melittangium boletus]ATB30052.1 hypothetical protein MEBOL_003507 [Melittangium boletus DSM 14713]
MNLSTHFSRLGWVVLLGSLVTGCATETAWRTELGADPVKTVASPAPEELSDFVLVLHSAPGRGMTHEWRRAETIDLSAYQHPARASGSSGGVVFAAMQPRDCHAELLDCVARCMRRPLPRGFGHMTLGNRGKGAKEQYCQDECMRPFRDCEESQGRQLHEFSAMDKAVDWLERHSQVLLAGSVVIIAGVVFVTVSAGAGLLVLVPATLLSVAAPGSVGERVALQ